MKFRDIRNSLLKMSDAMSNQSEEIMVSETIDTVNYKNLFYIQDIIFYMSQYLDDKDLYTVMKAHRDLFELLTSNPSFLIRVFEYVSNNKTQPFISSLTEHLSAQKTLRDIIPYEINGSSQYDTAANFSLVYAGSLTVILYLFVLPAIIAMMFLNNRRPFMDYSVDGDNNLEILNDVVFGGIVLGGPIGLIAGGLGLLNIKDARTPIPAIHDTKLAFNILPSMTENYNSLRHHYKGMRKYPRLPLFFFNEEKLSSQINAQTSADPKKLYVVTRSLMLGDITTSTKNSDKQQSQLEITISHHTNEQTLLTHQPPNYGTERKYRR